MRGHQQPSLILFIHVLVGRSVLEKRGLWLVIALHTALDVAFLSVLLEV